MSQALFVASLLHSLCLPTSTSLTSFIKPEWGWPHRPGLKMNTSGIILTQEITACPFYILCESYCVLFIICITYMFRLAMIVILVAHVCNSYLFHFNYRYWYWKKRYMTLGIKTFILLAYYLNNIT